MWIISGVFFSSQTNPNTSPWNPPMPLPFCWSQMTTFHKFLECKSHSKMIATRRISFNLYDKPRLYSYEWYPEKLGYCEVINPANTSVATRTPSFSRDHPSHPKLGELRLEIDARQNSDKGAPICHRIEIFGNQQCGRRHEKAIKCRS